CQCVSLAFRSGGNPRQLAAFSDNASGKSVPLITLRSDARQAGKCFQFVPHVTRYRLGRTGEVYFSRATTNSGAQSSARLISESGKVQMALRADSAYCAARVVAESSDP